MQPEVPAGSVLRRIIEWNDRKTREWEEKYPGYRAARAKIASEQQRVKDAQAETSFLKDSIAQNQGFASHAHKKATKRAMKKGYRLCATCGATVRPQKPWGFTRIVTLSLIEPGAGECPRCKGVDFRAPPVGVDP